MEIIESLVLGMVIGLNCFNYWKLRKTHQEIEKIYSRHAAVEKRFGHIERSMEMLASRMKMKDK